MQPDLKRWVLPGYLRELSAVELRSSMIDFCNSVRRRPHGQADRLLTMDEPAQLTRLPIATLRYKRYDGTRPRSFRLGRRVIYWFSDVLAWIDHHYNGEGPQAA